MDYFVTPVIKFFQNVDHQPLFDQLKRQNQQFRATESTKLLVDNGVCKGKAALFDIPAERMVNMKGRVGMGSTEYVSEDEGSEDGELQLQGATGKDLAMNMFRKLAKLFAYTSLQDKFLLFLGIIATVIHAASFPILAILFGKISNAYIVQTLLTMKNSNSARSNNLTSNDVGETGKFALSFLSKVTGNMNPAMNISAIPAGSMSGGGYFGNFSLYNSNGNETAEDFANYIADFSFNYLYIGVAVFFASFIQTLTWECVAENQLYRVKQKYIFQLLRQDLSWFSRRAAGNLVLKMADDCERYREGVGQKFVLVIEHVVILLFGAGLGLLTNTKLTLVFLACAPFIFTKLFVMWMKMTKKSSLAKKEYSRASKVSAEVIMGMKAVTALSGEKWEVRRYKSALLKGAKAAESREIFVGVGVGGMYFLIHAFYAIALWYSVNLLAEGAITAGEIYTVFFSLTICAFALGSLLPYINSIAESYASIKMLGTVLNSVPDIDPYSLEGERPKYFTGKISFSNMTFSYPGGEDRPVFKDFELEFPERGTIGVVGRGRSGKSTLINLMLRFYDPQVGQIKYDNYDLRALNVRWVREQIAVVDQRAALYNTTILDNIRSLRKDILLADVIKVAKLSMAHGFISQLKEGYMTRLVLPSGKDLSVGQRVQICIAKCLLKNPKILILDEVLSALDRSTAEKLLKKLAEYRKSATTIIFDNKLAAGRGVDKIFVLQEGQIVEQGTDKELVELKGVYHHMLLQENLIEEEESEVSHEHQHKVKFLEMQDETGQDKFGLNEDSYIFEDMPSIRKILSLLPRKNYILFWGVLGCVLSGLVVPLLSLCLGKILDMFVGDQNHLFTSGIHWVEFLTFLAFLAGIGYCMRTIYIGFLGEQLSIQMRLASYESTLRQPISWFDDADYNPQYLYARLSSDIPFIRSAVGPRLGIALSALVTMLFGLAVSAYYSWKLALIASLTIPVIIIGFYCQRSVLRRSHLKLTGLRKKLLAITNGVVKNILEIQRNCKALAVCQRAEQFIYPALMVGQKRATIYALVYAASECFMFLIFGITFRVGAELTRTGQIPISSLFVVFFVLTFGSLSLGQATSFIPEFFRARLSSIFVFDIIEKSHHVDPYDNTGQKTVIKGKIEFRDVIFSYPLTPHIITLKKINMTIPAGSFIGIVGPSGSGKTTLFALLERFYEPHFGEIRIDDVNILHINLKHLRDNIGYVAYDPILFDLSVKQNIAYGYQGNAEGQELSDLVEAAAKAASADYMIDELPHKYDTRCGEHGKHLNTGQRQAVAIARVVMKDPPILVFDDPTRQLDAEEEKRVQNTMYNITKGKTTIIASNSYSSIKHCDYIAFMNKGRIIEFGKQQDLLREKGQYYKFLHQIGAKFAEST